MVEERIQDLEEDAHKARDEDAAYRGEIAALNAERVAAKKKLEVALKDRREKAEEFEVLQRRMAECSEETAVVEAKHRACKKSTDALAAKVVELREAHRERQKQVSAALQEAKDCE